MNNRKSSYDTELGAKIAKQYADEFQPIMLRILAEHSDEARQTLQAETCSLFAAFILSISINFLRSNKAPQTWIDEICGDTIRMAECMAQNGTFHKVGEH